MSPIGVNERIAQLFGDLPGARQGVLQVAAVCSNLDNTLSVLKIRPESPKSDGDRFSLNLARARADAIVTSGKILREEPGVTHTLPEELSDWRRTELGKPLAPISAVLSSGRDLDLDHPLLRQSPHPLVFTSLESTARLAAGAASRAIELVGSDAPSLMGLIDFLRRDKRARTVSLEAGPTTILPLYGHRPPIVDELMLSTFQGPVSPDLVGPPFLTTAELNAHFPIRSTEQTIQEPSGPWSFRRYRRG